jgi:ribosomal protein S18 acetylase RimI-like enzyme
MERPDKIETIKSKFSLMPAKLGDCELMFRLQKLDGAEINTQDVEQIVRLEEYRKIFVPEEIEVVYHGDVPVGRLRVVRGDELYVGGMQILPEYRGKGIGTAILESLIEEAGKSAKPIRLEVFHENLQALSLYEKVGFKIVDENEQQKIMIYTP